MRATGIIRRVDNLGRVVIPKEVRRSMRFRDNDPVEIFTDDGSVIIRKVAPKNLHHVAVNISLTLFKYVKSPILICNQDIALEVVGNDALSARLRGLRISSALYNYNSKVLQGYAKDSVLYPIEDCEDIVAFKTEPIINDSRDIFGSLSLLGGEDSQISEDNLIRLQTAVKYIGDQFAEI